MAADPKFDVVDVKAKPVSPFYGCYNGKRPVTGQPVHGTNGSVVPYRFSTECRYDKSQTDTRCGDCKHRKEFDSWHEKDK